MITIYTTDTCPRCKILKKKLAEKGLEYSECSDTEKMSELGILSVPVMTVDGRIMGFMDAVKYVNER